MYPNLASFLNALMLDHTSWWPKIQALPCCDAIGSAVSVWTSSLVFLSRCCVCVCVSFVLLFFVFFVMGWFGFFALLWLVSKLFCFHPENWGRWTLLTLLTDIFKGGETTNWLWFDSFLVCFFLLNTGKNQYFLGIYFFESILDSMDEHQTENYQTTCV